MVEVAAGMDLDCPDGRRTETRRTRLSSKLTTKGMSDYEELIQTYWAVPDSGREMIRTLNRYWSGPRNPGVRFVAYDGGKPIGKLFEPERTAGSSLRLRNVRAARGARKGLATTMMNLALQREVDRSSQDGAACEQHGEGPLSADGVQRAMPVARLMPRHRCSAHTITD